jgi:hypothetical protein
MILYYNFYTVRSAVYDFCSEVGQGSEITREKINSLNYVLESSMAEVLSPFEVALLKILLDLLDARYNASYSPEYIRFPKGEWYTRKIEEDSDSRYNCIDYDFDIIEYRRMSNCAFAIKINGKCSLLRSYSDLDKFIKSFSRPLIREMAISQIDDEWSCTLTRTLKFVRAYTEFINDNNHCHLSNEENEVEYRSSLRKIRSVKDLIGSFEKDRKFVDKGIGLTFTLDDDGNNIIVTDGKTEIREYLRFDLSKDIGLFYQLMSLINKFPFPSSDDDE